MYSSKLTYVVCLVLLLGVVSNSSADTYFWWQPASGNWGTAGSWDRGVVPTQPNNDPNYAIVNNGTCSVTDNRGSDRLLIGYDTLGATQPPTVTVSVGADLHTRYELMFGTLANSDGVLNLNGTAYGENLELGMATGSTGTINVGNLGLLTIGWWGCSVGMTGTGTINLNGNGSMTTYGDTNTTLTMTGTGHIDIEDGTLSVYGDFRTRIQGYIDNGWITGYDGAGAVNPPVYNAVTGFTTVTATMSYTTFWVPASGDWGTAGNWSLGFVPTQPNANAITAIIDAGTCNVTSNRGSDRLYIGTDNTDNATKPPTVNVSAGAELHIHYELIMGTVYDTVAVLNLNGGTAYAEQLVMGEQTESSATIKVANGGSLTIGWWGCYIGELGNATIDLNGNASMTSYSILNMTGTGHIDIESGTLAVYGNYQTQLQGYINNGWITAYDGTGTVNAAYYDSGTGYTTVTASSAPGSGSNVVSVSAAVASSEYSGSVPATNTINGSGMTGDYHNTDYGSTWMTSAGGGGGSNLHSGTRPGTSWITYTFNNPYVLKSLWVWNYNGDVGGDVTTRGLKDVFIEYTSDGVNWQKLDHYVFNRATHEASYAHNTTIYFNSVVVKGVTITTQGGANLGNWGDGGPYYGLSEVRFYGTVYTNNYASHPSPADDVNKVAKAPTLSWLKGTSAAATNGHDVYFGTNSAAVDSATHASAEFKGTQTANSYNPGTLTFGNTYYWRIDEVNGVNVWKGDVWGFTVRPPIVMMLNRGVSLDRQFSQIPPQSPSAFVPADIQIIRSMGFDYVKVIFNPACFISGSTINQSNMWYLDEAVNKVLNEGLPIIICIHPEYSFKQTYLGGTWAKFQELLDFYEDFAAYIAARWSPDEVVFQLMSEPCGNTWNWNTLQSSLWQYVRAGMPNHTLILSGDQAAIIEGLLNVTPVDDNNVRYCFEGYEPFIFSWQGGYPWAGGYIQYLQHVPWPSNPTVISSRMTDMLTNVPSNLRTQAQTDLTTYGSQNWNKSYLYSSRISQAVNWSANHNNRKLFVGEWGVYDPAVYPSERYQYVKDLRELCAEHSIVQTYWSYNETFTVFKPDRIPCSKSPSYDWIDPNMCNALGVNSPTYRLYSLSTPAGAWWPDPNGWKWIKWPANQTPAGPPNDNTFNISAGDIYMDYPTIDGNCYINSGVVATPFQLAIAAQPQQGILSIWSTGGGGSSYGLNVKAALILGNFTNSKGVLNIYGGTAYAEELQCGLSSGATSTINVSDGGSLTIGWWGCFLGQDTSYNPQGTATISLTGTSSMTVMGDANTTPGGRDGIQMYSNSHIYIALGTLTVWGNHVTQLQGYVNSGWMTSTISGCILKVSYDGSYTTVKSVAVPTFVAAGSVASGAGAITPALPAGIATNDILLLFLETANQAITIPTPNGGTWTQVTSSPQGTGTAGGTSATRLTVFWSRYNGTQGAPTTSDSGDHQLGRIIAIRGAVTSGNPWNVTAGGVEATSDTSGSIPGATTTIGNTLVVAAIAAALPDADGTADFSSWANANLTSVTERTDNTTSAGNGGGLGIATGIKATAGAYGNTTVTLGSAAYKGMMSIAITP